MTREEKIINVAGLVYTLRDLLVHKKQLNYEKNL